MLLGYYFFGGAILFLLYCSPLLKIFINLINFGVSLWQLSGFLLEGGKNR